MPKTTGHRAAIAAFFVPAGLMAMPLAAQVTADDVWAADTAVMTAAGLVPHGELLRDGRTVTLTGWGARYDLLGFAHVEFMLGEILYHEQDDGTVTVDPGESLGVSVSVSIMDEFDLSASFQIEPQGLIWTISGTPDAVRTDFVADRLLFSFEDLQSSSLTDIESADIDLLMVIEGYRTISTISRGETLTQSGEGRIDRFVTDMQMGFGDFGTRSVAEYLDTTYSSYVVFPQAPLDLANLGAALRDGFRAESSGTSGATRSQTVTRLYGELSSDERQSVRSSEQALVLDRNGLLVRGSAQGLEFNQTAMGYSTFSIGLGAERIEADLVLPLLAEDGQSHISRLKFGIGGLRLDPTTMTSLGLPTSDLFHSPLDLDVETSFTFAPAIDLTDFNGFMARAESGESLGTVYGGRLDSLTASWAGATVFGEGHLGWGDAGASLTDEIEPPTGEFDFTIAGAYALLDRLGQDGTIPRDALLAARGGLAAIGRAVGADQLRSTITIGPNGSVLVNGAPIPF